MIHLRSDYFFVAFIHSKKRNRLGNAKVEKLAFVYCNLAIVDMECQKKVKEKSESFDFFEEFVDCS